MSTEWGQLLDINSVGALNDKIAKGRIAELILVQEALQEKKIAGIAEKIAMDSNKKMVMIAGPSSSGKTTFSHRLSVQLMTYGLKPHPIPVDDYFVNREDSPVDEYGNKNYECLEAIDVELFNRDMLKLLEGERVELPTYNFISGKREYGKGKYFRGRDWRTGPGKADGFYARGCDAYCSGGKCNPISVLFIKNILLADSGIICRDIFGNRYQCEGFSEK